MNPGDIIEQVVSEKVSKIDENTLNEQSLTEALEAANLTLLRVWQETKQPLKASAIVIAIKRCKQPTIDTNSKAGLESESAEIYIAGAGDSRVYEVFPEKLSLIFSDPKNIQAAVSETPESRTNSLKNVLGHSPRIDVHCRKIPSRMTQNFFIATWGLFSQSTPWEMLKMGLKPDFLKGKAAESLLSRMKFESTVSCCAVKFENHLLSSSDKSSRSKQGRHSMNSQHLKTPLASSRLSFACFLSLIVFTGAFQLAFAQNAPLSKKNRVEITRSNVEAMMRPSPIKE